jgi:hypothetical protein
MTINDLIFIYLTPTLLPILLILPKPYVVFLQQYNNKVLILFFIEFKKTIMSNLDDHKQNQQHQEYFPPTVATAPPVADVEINVSKSPPAGTTTTHVATAAPVTVVEKKSPDTMFGVSEIVQRRKREDFMKIGSLTLTGLALLFSLFSCTLMALLNCG